MEAKLSLQQVWWKEENIGGLSSSSRTNKQLVSGYTRKILALQTPYMAKNTVAFPNALRDP